MAWKDSIGFSERLANIMAITAAYRQALSGKDFDATARAREAEEHIFQEAESLQDYQQRCVCLQEEILPAAVSETLEETAESEDDEAAQTMVAIGPYQDAKFYKDGLFSTVFKASAISNEEKRLEGSLVALKVTTESTMQPPHSSAREARLLRAAASLSSVTNNNIIPLFSTLTLPPGRLVLVFPFCRYDLSHLLQHRPSTLTPLLKHQILHALFSALTYIHSLSMIHRDIKPSNLLLQAPLNDPLNPPSIYLSDFGIAWSPSDHSPSEPPTQKITDVGTTCYRPPEILFGDTSYDSSLDMWAAGCVAAELVRPKHEPLFDAGPTGSELGLIKSIFSTLGTPDEQVWPSTSRLPDFHKMAFHRYPPRPWSDIIPLPVVAHTSATAANKDMIELVTYLVRYEMKWRWTAEQALEFLRERVLPGFVMP